jgi:hypothetical protein
MKLILIILILALAGAAYAVIGFGPNAQFGIRTVLSGRNVPEQFNILVFEKAISHSQDHNMIQSAGCAVFASEHALPFPFEYEIADSCAGIAKYFSLTGLIADILVFFTVFAGLGFAGAWLLRKAR